MPDKLASALPWHYRVLHFACKSAEQAAMRRPNVVQIIGWTSFAVAGAAFVFMPDGALRLGIALASTVVAVIVGIMTGGRE
jgi:hypothetical protein